jgi:hypothetical protein
VDNFLEKEVTVSGQGVSGHEDGRTLMDNGSDAQIDVAALQQLVENHPEEYRRLLEMATEPHLEDKHGRTVMVKDNITTPKGEKGMVIRIDKKSKRVLVRLDDTGKTRMLMAHRVVVRRGRPRKDDIAVAV